MKNFKDVYELPFEANDVGWVYDQKRNFCFQMEIDDEKAEKKLINAINGTEPLKNKDISFIASNGYIKAINVFGGFDQIVILIRGWGNLTGSRAMNLSDEEAINIQDTLAEYIIDKLNYREN